MKKSGAERAATSQDVVKGYVEADFIPLESPKADTQPSNKFEKKTPDFITHAPVAERRNTSAPTEEEKVAGFNAQKQPRRYPRIPHSYG